MLERQHNSDANQRKIPDPSNLEKFRLFIAFRILLYADVCHDFLGDRTKKSGWTKRSRTIFSKKQVDIMYNDIKWYKGELLGPNGKFPPDSNGEGFLTMFESRKLISWVRKSMYERSKKASPSDFIESEDIAKKVSKFVITKMFKLTPIPITKILGCGFDFNIIKISAILANLNGYFWDASSNLKLCVDMTMRGRNLLPIYTIIFKDHFRRKAFKSCGRDTITSLIKYGLDQTQPLIREGEIKFVTTYAQKFDSAGTNTIEKLLNIEDGGIVNFQDDTDVTILFFGVPIIIYKFIPQSDEASGVNLKIQKYFKLEKLGTRNSNTCSVSKIAADMAEVGPKLNPQIIPISAFKTLGDFLQIISYLFLEKSTYNTAFVTGDIICGQIASAFTKNVYCEVEDKGDPYGGISVYLSSEQQKLWSEQNPDVSAVLQEILTQSQVGDFLLESFLEDNDDPSFIDQLIKTNPSLVTQDTVRVGGKRKQAFGKIIDNLLKTKLENVDIAVTKLSSKGQILPLTRKEMEKKATEFENLQHRAKKYNIKLMYKSKSRGYVYKGFIRLTNDIIRKLGKSKFES